MTPITITGPFTATLSYDFKEVHTVSVGLLSALDANDVPVGLGAAGAALTFGKLMAPGALSNEEQAQFLNDLMEWVGAYFTEGLLN